MVSLGYMEEFRSHGYAAKQLINRVYRVAWCEMGTIKHAFTDMRRLGWIGMGKAAMSTSRLLSMHI